MTENSAKMIEHSDGALTEITVLDEFVSDFHNGQKVDFDDMLALNKRALDHLNSLRVLLKKEAVK